MYRACSDTRSRAPLLSRHAGIRDLVRPCGLVGLLVVALQVPAAHAQGTTSASGEPTTPAVQERDIKSLSEEAPVKKWKPGDPVRVVPDLREDDGPDTGDGSAQEQPRQPLEPNVREPVAPKVMERSVDELSTVEPYKEGDPVRVVPDLKQNGSGKSRGGCGT